LPLAISEVEAAALADASNKLIKYYGFTPKGPAMLWINFAATAGMIYVPRVLVLAKMRKTHPPSPKAPAGTANNVVDFPKPADVDPIPPMSGGNGMDDTGLQRV
jgi:hypothetical protein